jgi:hypothetical protein
MTTMRLSISVKPQDKAIAERLAEGYKVTVSGLFARLVREAYQRQLEAALERGYEEMAEEHLSGARMAFPAQSEIALRGE